MNELLASIPWATVLVALPFAGGLIALRIPEHRTRHALGVGVATLVFVIAAALALVFILSPGSQPIEDVSAPLPWLGVRWHLAIDELSAPFLPLAALIVVLLLVAAPRRELDGVMIPAVLLTEAATLGVYTAVDLGCLTLFWIACLAPGAFALRRSIPGRGPSRAFRAYGVFLGLGAVPILAGVAMIVSARASSGVALPFDLTEGAPALDVGRQAPIFLLLASALLVRKAVLPFHSWLPVLTERGPVSITVLLIGTHLGAFLASRVILPILPDASAQYFPWIADLALASALYGGLVGLAQHDLRRMLGFVLTSQMGLVLVGVAEANRDSLHGALLQMLALGLTSTGLLLLTAQLEARAGTTDIRHLGGAAARFPFLAGSFFVLGIAAIGFPGSLMFVSEDLLLHGLLGAHPIEATGLLVVTVLNGIAIVRAFFLAFLGTARRPLGVTVPDLLPRERFVAVALTALLLVAGLSPTPLLRVRELVVQRLVLDHTPEHGSSGHESSAHESAGTGRAPAHAR
jgi:NADH-quinone oxidoreductase subunit M